jgi:hypothetical protein
LHRTKIETPDEKSSGWKRVSAVKISISAKEWRSMLAADKLDFFSAEKSKIKLNAAEPGRRARVRREADVRAASFLKKLCHGTAL